MATDPKQSNVDGINNVRREASRHFSNSKNEYLKAQIDELVTSSKKVNQSHYRPEVPRGFQEIKVPRLRDNGPGWW